MGKEVVVMVLAVTQLLEQDWGCPQSAGCPGAALTAQILTVQNTWVMLRGREGGVKGQDSVSSLFLLCSAAVFVRLSPLPQSVPAGVTGLVCSTVPRISF